MKVGKGKSMGAPGASSAPKALGKAKGSIMTPFSSRVVGSKGR